MKDFPGFLPLSQPDSAFSASSWSPCDRFELGLDAQAVSVGLRRRLSSRALPQEHETPGRSKTEDVHMPVRVRASPPFRCCKDCVSLCCENKSPSDIYIYILKGLLRDSNNSRLVPQNCTRVIGNHTPQICCKELCL